MEPILVHHFLVCREANYDWSQPAAPYCLKNLVFGSRLPDGATLPVTVPDLWLFVNLEGVGSRELWVELLWQSEDDEWELQAAYGPFAVWFGDELTSRQRGWHIRRVPFQFSGWFEFRLMESETVLTQEFIFLEE